MSATRRNLLLSLVTGLLAWLPRRARAAGRPGIELSDRDFALFVGPSLEQMVEDDKYRHRVMGQCKAALGPKWPAFVRGTLVDVSPDLSRRPKLLRALVAKAGALVLLWAGMAGGQQLPPPVALNGIPPTVEQVALGRKLFFDPRLSADGSVSCATCHQPERGFSDGRVVAVGIDGGVGNRHTPTVLMAAWSPLQFWDGRVIGLGLQSLQPLVNPLEMGNGSQNQVINRLNRIAGYRYLFEQAYGGRATRERFAHAMASFESTLVALDAPIDLRIKGYTRHWSAEVERGFGVFDRAGCMACHVYPLLTDFSFHNTGIALATGTGDQGRFAILGQNQRTAADRRAFKTPTLRQIALRAPYTHGGRVPSLEAIVAGYNAGWSPDPNKDRRIVPLGLSPQEQADLVVFLREGLTSPTSLIQAPGLPR